MVNGGVMWKKLKMLVGALINLVDLAALLLKEVLMASRSKRTVVEVYVPIFDLNSKSGELDLASGVNDVCVECDGQPTKVWFCFEDANEANGGIPVCAGEIDRVGISIMPNGFIIHAAISSNSRTLKWQAIF
jgi:hypothetical protein